MSRDWTACMTWAQLSPWETRGVWSPRHQGLVSAHLVGLISCDLSGFEICVAIPLAEIRTYPYSGIGHSSSVKKK